MIINSNQKDKKVFVQKEKEVGGIMTGVSVRKVLTMFVQIKSALFCFLT